MPHEAFAAAEQFAAEPTDPWVESAEIVFRRSPDLVIQRAVVRRETNGFREEEVYTAILALTRETVATPATRAAFEQLVAWKKKGGAERRLVLMSPYRLDPAELSRFVGTGEVLMVASYPRPSGKNWDTPLARNARQDTGADAK